MIDLEKVEIEGLQFFVRKESSDIKAIREVVEKNAYRRKNFELAGDWIDLGANIGAFSVMIAKRFGACVEAYEPDPQSFEILKDNIALNGLEDKINVHNVAVVSGVNRTVDFFVNGKNRNYWRNSLVKAWQGGTAIRVQAMHYGRIADFGRNVKMDIEGSEMKIIEDLVVPFGKRLVFEWSFDIDHSIVRFRAAIERLKGLYQNVIYRKFDETQKAWPRSWFPAAVMVWCY